MSEAGNGGRPGGPPSRFVINGGSWLTASARSSLHQMTFRAPVTGAVDVAIAAGTFALDFGVSALLEVDIQELRGSERLLDNELRRALDAQRYPFARASIDSARAAGAGKYALAGQLTLRGKTHPLDGEADVRLDGDHLYASGTITIDIRDFAIKPPSLLVVRVHPEVELDIDLSASRAVESPASR